MHENCACMFIFLCGPCVGGAHRGQKKDRIPLELALVMVVITMWVL